jgi:hypothetical protein
MGFTCKGRLQNAAAVLAGAAAALWLGLTPWFASPFEILRTGLLFLLFLVIRSCCMKRIASPTGSGAIVMAIGIFINGAIGHFSSLNHDFAQVLTIGLFLGFLFIAFSYAADAWKKRIFVAHFENHLGRFAVGTWIAGTSVCGVALCQRLPDWRPLVQFVVIGNIALWLYFVTKVLGSFLEFARGAWRKVHGVLFLSTVSTQSLVIVWKAAFGAGRGYALFAPWLISLGLVFYVLSFVLILRRYIHDGSGIDLDSGWFNTNCITHGAMSITGLASAVSGLVPPNLILLIWLWAVSWFIVIESIEIARAVRRVSLHGWAGGLLIYDPSQWSRNFTFGMLYAFTLNFDIAKNSAAASFLVVLQQVILRYFAWIVLILLLLEIFIFLRDRLSPPAASIS